MFACAICTATWTDGVLHNMMDYGVPRKVLRKLDSFWEEQGYDTDTVMIDAEGFNCSTFKMSTNTISIVIHALNGDKRRFGV